MQELTTVVIVLAIDLFGVYAIVFACRAMRGD